MLAECQGGWGCLGLSSPAGKRGWGREALTSGFSRGLDLRHPLPAEGPVTRRPWLTPAYRGWGVERVSRTGDRAGTGLSTPACSASPSFHASSEAPQPTIPHASRLPLHVSPQSTPAGCGLRRSAVPWTVRTPNAEGPWRVSGPTSSCTQGTRRKGVPLT